MLLSVLFLQRSQSSSYSPAACTIMVNVSHVSARRAVTDDQQNPRGTKHHAVDTEGLPVDRGYAWVIVFGMYRKSQMS